MVYYFLAKALVRPIEERNVRNAERTRRAGIVRRSMGNQLPLFGIAVPVVGVLLAADYEGRCEQEKTLGYSHATLLLLRYSLVRAIIITIMPAVVLTIWNVLARLLLAVPLRRPLMEGLSLCR